MTLSKISVEQAMTLLPQNLRALAGQLLATEKKTTLVVFQGPGAPEGKGVIWDAAARGLFFGLFT